MIAYVLLLTGLDVIAVIAARYYVEKKRNYILMISLICFSLSVLVFEELLQFSVTAVINILWVSLSNIFITILCYFLFKEKINRKQALGMVAILAGVLLV